MIGNEIASQIWKIAIKNNIWFSAEFIPGSENKADEPSRKFHDDLEWTLCPKVFNILCDIFVIPEIDLFASRLNHKLKNYCSWKRDPFATYINAFSISWNVFSCSYLFPPFSVVSKCLQKLQNDKAQAIIVAALWPNQIWFSTLLKLLIADPVVLPDVSSILSLPHTNAPHPLGQRLKLIACHISGISSQPKEYQKSLQMSSWLHGERPHRSNTQHTYVSGQNFAIGGTAIPFRLL